MQINLSRYTAVFVAEAPGDRIEDNSVCQQQRCMCMPEWMSGKFPAQYLKRYLFKVFVVTVINDEGTVLIWEKQIGPIAEKNAFLSDKDVDFPAKLE